MRGGGGGGDGDGAISVRGGVGDSEGSAKDGRDERRSAELRR